MNRTTKIGFSVAIVTVLLTEIVVTTWMTISRPSQKQNAETKVEVTYPWGKDTIRTREELSLNLDGVLSTRYSVLDSNVVSIRKVK